jgi:hypothetical protein
MTTDYYVIKKNDGHHIEVYAGTAYRKGKFEPLYVEPWRNAPCQIQLFPSEESAQETVTELVKHYPGPKYFIEHLSEM